MSEVSRGNEKGDEKRKTVHTYLTESEKQDLRRYAANQGLTQSAAIRQLILNASSELADTETASPIVLAS